VVVVKAWIEVSEERLVENFRTVAEAAGAETQVLGVVKANAYGHGAEVCSVALARTGAKWLGVADVVEGARVRAALDVAGFGAGPGKDDGAAPDILVMCGVMPGDTALDVALLEKHELTPVVWTVEQVGWLRGCAGMRVHVEVETGMGRQGVRTGAALEELLDAIGEVGLVVDGLCTHFCAAEVAHSARTRAQRIEFGEAVAQVRGRGLTLAWLHAGSSSTVDNPAPDGRWLVELAKTVGARAMVRSGIALYGYCQPIEDADSGAAVRPRVRPALRPVMQWKTRVLDVREVATGEAVGYNATFTAPGPMRVALLPVGYADGLRRELSGSDARPGGWVMIGGQRAGILGRVSMNLTTVDVSGIDGVRVGDEVVLLGDGVTADDHARIAGTISYEILCGVGKG
jgi:alanine racemase